MKYTLSLFFTVLFFQSFGQVKLKKQEEEKVLAACNSYLLENRLWFAESSYPDSSFRKVCGDSLFLILEISREEVFLMEYNLSTRKDSTYELLNNDTIFACKVRVSEHAYFLNVEQFEENWKVVSYNNQIITPNDLEMAQSRLDSMRQIATELTRIKETTTNFVTFWNELNYADSSENLRQVTTDLMYRHLVLSRQLDRLEGWGKKRDLELKEITDVEMIDTDSATCRVIIAGHGGTRFNLIKINGNWMISGENGGTKTLDDVQKLEERIADYKKGLEIQNSISEFNSAMELYFKKNDSTLLTPLASEAVMEYLHYFKQKCQDVNPLFIQVGGCRIAQYDVKKIKIEEEKATYCWNNFCVNFELINEKWKITGFNGGSEEQLIGRKVEVEFFDFTQFFRIFYATYLFNDSSDEVVESIEFIGDYDEENSKIYSPLETVDHPALYQGGINSLMTLINEKDQSTTFCHVSFVIEADGSITTVEILTPNLSEAERKSILTRIEKMENWQPAMKYKSAVRSRMIIGFYI